jgi:tetratricopeptide (TPR) repeat protein
MDDSLAIARELDLREQMAFTLTDLGNLRTLMGSALEGLNGLKEARALWRDLGNKPMLCFSLSLSAEMAALAGDIEIALEMTDESIAIATAIGNAEALAYARGMRGIALGCRGDIDAAIQTLFQAIEAAKSVGSAVLSAIPSYVLASTYATIGACDRAQVVRESLVKTGIADAMPPLFIAQMLLELGAVDRACSDPTEYIRTTTATIEGIASPNASIDIAQWAGVSLGAAHLALGELDQALANVDHFLTLAQHNDWRTRTAEALEIRARVLHALGSDEEEAATLAEARQLAEEIGLANVQWRVYGALADIEDRHQNEEEAATLRRAARSIVEQIAQSLEDPALKRGLLAMPEVRALIRGGSAA